MAFNGQTRISADTMQRMTDHSTPPLAYYVQAGDTLPPRALFGAARQTVVTTRFGDGPTITLVMDDGAEFTYGTTDAVIFPRRDDGSVRDWRESWRERVPVLSTEVYPGDTLTSPDGATEERSPLDQPMVVTMVSAFVKRGVWFVRLSCRHALGATTYVFRIDEPLSFPREARRGPQSRAQREGRPRWFGPYQDVRTGVLWEFTYHPHGRGRWPHDIKPWDPSLPPLIDRETGECLPRRARWPETTWSDFLVPQAVDLPIGREIKRRGAQQNRSWSSGNEMPESVRQELLAQREAGTL